MGSEPASPRLPGWLPTALAVVSLTYVAAGAYWSSGSALFPIGPQHDPLGKDQSLLATVDRATAWPYVIGLAGMGFVTAVGLRRGLRGPLAPVVTTLAVAQGLLYVIVLPDGRPLIAAAHVPVLLVAKPFGWPPGVTISSQLPWPVVHQGVLMAVGAGWLLSALLHGRGRRAACVWCGRRDLSGTDPAEARCWGRWAVAAAMVPPVAYASSRIAWAFDIPYGVTRDFLVDMRADEPTIFVAGAMMALLGLAGATLTFGLVATWGERWPRWVPYVRGRTVPPRVAVVPGMTVAALLISAGKGWYVSAFSGHLPEAVFGENWATVIFGATLPVWGVALGVATYAYWLRRRGTCSRCGRGRPDPATGRPVAARRGSADRGIPRRQRHPEDGGVPDRRSPTRGATVTASTPSASPSEGERLRSVVVYSLMSLDGVAEEPGDWMFDVDPEVFSFLGRVIETQDDVLLGRGTYDYWVDYWPTSDVEPFAGFINSTPKHVFSSTPLRGTWTNEQLVAVPLEDHVRGLKAGPGGDIGVHGSITLVQALLAANLVDELNLVVTPTIAGRGARLFPSGIDGPLRLTCTSESRTPSGTLLLSYAAGADE